LARSTSLTGIGTSSIRISMTVNLGPAYDSFGGGVRTVSG
jgi:hypothetical protein